MQATDNKEIVLRFYEEIVNTGNVSEISNYLSEENIEVLDGKRYSIGIGGLAQFWKSVRYTS